MTRSGSVRVWLVDGSFVRATIDQEFGPYGHHYSHPTIARQEIWVDAEGIADDPQSVARRALIERRLMARGMDYEAARSVATTEERKLRRPRRQ